MSPRRKSIDSSGSSGEESGDSRGYKKDKKDKKDKDKKDKDKSSKDKDKKDKDKDKKDKDKDKKDKDKSEKKDHKDKDKKEKDKDKDVKAHKDIAGSGFSANPQAPMYGYRDGGDQQFSSPPIVPPHFDASRSPGFSDAPPPFPETPSAPHVQTGAPPPSGYRLPLSTTEAFADPYQTGQPPFWDADGTSPIFIGSALFETSVHPCKIGPHLQPFVSVAWGGQEHGHHGRYDLLPFVPETMEWVVTSYGRIPPGRRPIEGGYEENGAKLYHGAAVINGIRIPGKAGEHLSGCNVAFGGSEVAVTDHEILCWR